MVNDTIVPTTKFIITHYTSVKLSLFQRVKIYICNVMSILRKNSL